MKSNFFNGVCWRKPAKASASLAKSSLFKRGSYINIIIGFSCSRAAVTLALGSSEGSVHEKSSSKMIYEHMHPMALFSWKLLGQKQKTPLLPHFLKIICKVYLLLVQSIFVAYFRTCSLNFVIEASAISGKIIHLMEF